MAQVVQEVSDSKAAEVRSRDLIGFGVTLGIGAGLIEAAMATIRSGRTALLIGRGGDFLWMAPLVGLLLGLSSVMVTLGRLVRYPRRASGNRS
jgi:hypothetical protein